MGVGRGRGVAGEITVGEGVGESTGAPLNTSETASPIACTIGGQDLCLSCIKEDPMNRRRCVWPLLLALSLSVTVASCADDGGATVELVDGGGEGDTAVREDVVVEDVRADVAEDAAELPDHAAIELEYSAYLLECAAEVGESGDGSRILERQEEFESRFVRTWLPELGRRIEDCGVHEFYAGVGMLLRRLPAVATGLREVG